MYVYIQTDKNQWTVGFYDPNGNFIPESDWELAHQAAIRVHWLNGGEIHP